MFPSFYVEPFWQWAGEHWLFICLTIVGVSGAAYWLFWPRASRETP